ncbi:MAG: hypothetical protein ACN4GM_10905 [Gammaproteobacteria bacterium]
MQAAELVNQFLIYAILWLILIPITYLLAKKKKTSIVEKLIFTIGSIALSALLIMFSYTLLANIGLITLLASINSILANIVIILLIMLAPVLVASGHYKLEHYNSEKSEGEGNS